MAKKRSRFHDLWLILAAYGVFFALLSGVEEILHGKYWKAIISLTLGFIVYLIIENRR